MVVGQHDANRFHGVHSSLHSLHLLTNVWQLCVPADRSWIVYALIISYNGTGSERALPGHDGMHDCQENALLIAI
jgi:hypothetical protein